MTICRPYVAVFDLRWLECEFIVDLREPFIDLNGSRLVVLCQPEKILFRPNRAGSVDLRGPCVDFRALCVSLIGPSIDLRWPSVSPIWPCVVLRRLRSEWVLC